MMGNSDADSEFSTDKPNLKFYVYVITEIIDLQESLEIILKGINKKKIYSFSPYLLCI